LLEVPAAVLETCSRRETPLQDIDITSIDWVARARDLAAVVASGATRAERDRRIPDEVVAAVDDAGILRMLLPVALGGGAADILTFNRTMEAVAAADGSTAWCLAQSIASSHAAGFLEPRVAREVFASPKAIVAWGPPGAATRAQVVDGGYMTTGRWRFASGSANATWMGGHSQVFERDGKPRLDGSGRPVMRTMIFRPDKATIHDTWHVLGLRGTASNDYEVKDLFVPEAYSTWRDLAADRREGGPLYNIPLLTLYGIGFSGVALGLADASIRAFMKLAETKKPGGGLGAQTVLRDNAVIQSKVAQAMGRLESGRALLHRMLEEIWQASCTAGTIPLAQRAMLRVAIVGAIDQAREVVDFSYHAAGTTAIFEGSAFERRFRDMHTLLAQGQAHLSNFESAGQALFGVEPTQRL
jgi:alkylation response protein AidB-like acyl-CoA dehydrogenase